MSKHNTLAKRFKKQFLSINNSIESYFNRLRHFVINIKKSKFTSDNKVFITSGVIIIVFLSYFLIPTFYNKNIIELEIKNQIQKKYNIEIKYNDKINYGLLPKPHFSAKNLSLIKNNREIAKIDNFKIFISINNFFSINKIETKDLIFKNADFNIYKKDLAFFKELLATEPNENKIVFKNCKIFFKNLKDEVLFINKIKKSEFYYDSNNLENVLISRNEIFKTPFKLKIKNDKFNKEVIAIFNSNKVRLNIENEIDYNEDDIVGILDLLFVNKGTSLNYLIKKNSLSFKSQDSNNTYSGNIDFKPFYFTANFNYQGLSTKNLFNDDSFLVDFLKTDILNNKNLNSDIQLKVKDLTNIDELNNLILKTNIKQGDIGFSDSSINWRDSVKITLSDSLLIQENNEINLIGTFIFDFIDLNNFYRAFQINKNDRKKIDQVQIDFVYSFNKKEINFDNAKIDNNSNIDLQKFLDDFNSREIRLFNKITFKNFVNNFFDVYAG